jgi:hypothetical protein
MVNVPQTMKATIQAAAMIASAQSLMLEAQKLANKLSRDTGAEKHGNDHSVQKILNLGHSAIPIFEGCGYRAITLSTDGFMHG